MNREQRRAAGKKAKKDGNKELEEKMFLFGKLQDECLACSKPFDKTSKEMVMSWQVIVHEKEEKVNLYCPDCWSKAQEVIHSFIEHIENKDGGEE
jgi:Zn finger protein HypA/HybF involved in hydrogenase expression